jgi:hypothetical protein
MLPDKKRSVIGWVPKPNLQTPADFSTHRESLDSDVDPGRDGFAVASQLPPLFVLGELRRRGSRVAFLPGGEQP